MSTNNTDVTSVTPELAAVEAMVQLFVLMRAYMTQDLVRQGCTLSPLHLRVLTRCLQHPGANQQALGQAIGRDKGQIARLIKELDAQGLVLRTPDPKDGRCYTLHITAAGQQACQVFQTLELDMAQRLFSHAAPEALQTFTALARSAQTQLQGSMAQENDEK